MLDHGVTDDGAPFIVMEYLEGRNLGEVLRDEGALPAEEVVAIVTQVARALSRVHAAELLHRDVKPENIFLCDGDGETFVKLLDFGIVKSNRDALDTQTKTGQVVGTPFYMSPEQMMGQKEIDARSDLWSLGVVAYECLTGKRPFDGPSFGAVAVNIATGAPMPPSEASPAIPVTVDAWFQRACARTPTDRFASAKDLADGLRDAFGSAISAPLSSVAVSFDESKPERALAPTVAEGANAEGTKSSSSSSLASSSAREAIGLAKTEFGLEGGLSKTARPSSKAGVFVAAFSLVVGAGGAVFFLANRNAEGGRAPVANRTAPISTARTNAPSTARGAAPKEATDPASDSSRTASNEERSQGASSHGDGRATSPSRSSSKAATSDLGDAAVDGSPAPDAGEAAAASPDAGASPSSLPSSSSTAAAAVKPSEPEPSPEARDAEAPETRRDAATKTW